MHRAAASPRRRRETSQQGREEADIDKPRSECLPPIKPEKPRQSDVKPDCVAATRDRSYVWMQCININCGVIIFSADVRTLSAAHVRRDGSNAAAGGTDLAVPCVCCWELSILAGSME